MVIWGSEESFNFSFGVKKTVAQRTYRMTSAVGDDIHIPMVS